MKIDKAKVDMIIELYKKGYSILKISKTLGISRLTIRKYLRQHGLLPARQEQPTVPDDIEDEQIEEQEEEVMQDVQPSSEYLNAKKVLKEYGFEEYTDLPSTSPAGRLIQEIKQREWELRALRRELSRLGLGGSTTPTVHGSGLKGLLEYKKELDEKIEEAREVLEALGYKVIKPGKERTDTDENVEELIEKLKSMGYEINRRVISKEELQKIIEEEKRRWEEEHNIQVERGLEEQKIKTAERIVEIAIDRIVNLFQPVVHKYTDDQISRIVGKKTQTKNVLAEVRKIRGATNE